MAPFYILYFFFLQLSELYFESHLKNFLIKKKSYSFTTVKQLTSRAKPHVVSVCCPTLVSFDQLQSILTVQTFEGTQDVQNGRSKFYTTTILHLMLCQSTNCSTKEIQHENSGGLNKPIWLKIFTPQRLFPGFEEYCCILKKELVRAEKYRFEKKMQGCGVDLCNPLYLCLRLAAQSYISHCLPFTV